MHGGVMPKAPAGYELLHAPGLKLGYLSWNTAKACEEHIFLQLARDPTQVGHLLSSLSRNSGHNNRK